MSIVARVLVGMIAAECRVLEQLKVLMQSR